MRNIIKANEFVKHIKSNLLDYLRDYWINIKKYEKEVFKRKNHIWGWVEFCG